MKIEAARCEGNLCKFLLLSVSLFPLVLSHIEQSSEFSVGLGIVTNDEKYCQIGNFDIHDALISFALFNGNPREIDILQSSDNGGTPDGTMTAHGRVIFVNRIKTFDNTKPSSGTFLTLSDAW